MKNLKLLTAGFLCAAFLAAPFAGSAVADENKTSSKAAAKAKPYTLKTCAVSGEELGGMGKAYVFEYEGREIKLCCKSCYKDFNKEPAKYIKKVEEAEAKEAAKAKAKATK
jgi:YHS domain-containing protein